MARIFCKITQFLSYKQFILLKFQKRVKKIWMFSEKRLSLRKKQTNFMILTT